MIYILIHFSANPSSFSAPIWTLSLTATLHHSTGGRGHGDTSGGGVAEGSQSFNAANVFPLAAGGFCLTSLLLAVVWFSDSAVYEVTGVTKRVEKKE